MEDYLAKKYGRPHPEKNDKKQTIITKNYLKRLCEYEKKYSQPHLNDSLMLQMKGFALIDNLDEFYN